MKTIAGNKGTIIRIWTDDEHIEDELDRTFEIVSDHIYQFDGGYPIPDRTSVMGLFCEIEGGGIIQVAKAINMSTMQTGELIWGKGKTKFRVLGTDGNVENPESLFIFLPLAEDNNNTPPGEYMSATPSLPITDTDAYDFAVRFCSFFDIRANLHNINTIMADLIIWMVQMYKIAELNQDNCTFAEMLQKATAEDPRYANVIAIANELKETPFTANDVTDVLLKEIEDEEDSDDPE